MKIKDLKEGDKIWVKCPFDSDIWREETITNVLIAEDGYPGSGWWFMRINTDDCQNNVNNKDVSEGKHWDILVKSLTEDSRYLADANAFNKMLISADNPFEEEKKRVQTLKDIIKESVLFRLEHNDHFPDHAIVVGMSNSSWECHEFFR